MTIRPDGVNCNFSWPTVVQRRYQLTPYNCIHFYLWNIRIYNIRSVHALRLDTSQRPFHFDFSVTWVHSLRPKISHRFIHFGIKAYGSKYLALRPKKYFDPTPSIESFTSKHSLRERKSIEVHASPLQKSHFSYFSSTISA